jgi:3-oxoacyl-[acyl-carrier protein] reductase
MNIIVTGASRGIGFELVKRFAENEENRIIAISRNLQNLRTLQGVCKNINENTEVIGVKYDITSADIEKELLPQISKYFDKVDILINNAG